MIKLYKQRVCLLVFFCMVNMLSPFMTCEAKTNEKIKVGYYEDGDFMSKNDNKEYVGFNFEFLQEVAKYTGWEYEVVEGGSWENTYKMLENGEIDLLPSVYYTEAREKTMKFSTEPMCNIYSTLNVREDDIRYDYEDFETFKGMKVGIIKGSLDAENFVKYCIEHNIDVKIVPYEETGNLLADLANSKLDGMAISNLGKSSTFKSIGQFAPEPIYFAVSKNQESLLTELNAALNKIRLRNPYYQSEMYDKYFSYNTSQKPVFTKEEKEYIKEVGTIKAIYDSSWAPLEYRDAKTGGFVGVTADLFEQISKETGLEFEYIPRIKLANIFEMLKANEADIVCGVASDYLWGEQNYFNTTGAYLSAQIVQISVSSDMNNDIIAMPEGYYLSKRVEKENPDKTIKYYKSVEACFHALANGAADSTYANLYLSDYLLSNPKFEQFSVMALADYTDEIGIGISKSADPRLFSILDKCVQYTSSAAVDEMVLKNSIVTRELNWRDVMGKYPLQIICGIILFFLVITMFLVSSMRTKLKNQKQIQRLMYQDDLTGIGNLNKFRIEAKQIIDENANGSFAMVYTDISQFKTINDNFGFVEGDELLRMYANVLNTQITNQECCARVSADHFVLLIQYQTWEELKSRTYAIDKQINEEVLGKGKPYHLILVFGVYVIKKEENKEISLILDFANYARKSIKVPHKSMVILYDEAMREEELLKKQLVDVMEPALENGEFIPYFQPKVDMVTGECVGSEALVRWKHAERGLIPPGHFIPYFEENGFIVEVDMYMYEKVCQEIRKWIDEGIPVKTVSCNFSRLHFKNDYFPIALDTIAEKYKIPRHYLELEITESVVMDDLNRVLEQLNDLKALGFLISIDDFGSGYSSLGLLQQLSVDVLKLDQSFLRKGLEGKQQQVIIRSIISIAEDLDISIVCEGVETKEQADILIKLNARVAQGYYYAKPMPQEEFEKVMRG